MPPSRIDLADPSDEGRSIAEALRGKGFVVSERSIESLKEGSDAALVLLAGDDPVTIDALTALKESKPSIPIILLGHPLGAEDAEVTSIRPLGADAHYARPVAVDRLVRKVETLLSPAETRLAPVRDGADEAGSDDARPSEPPPSTGDERSLVSWTPREPTVSLTGDITTGDGLEGLLEDEISAEVSGIAEVTGVSLRDDLPSIEEALLGHDPDDPVSQVARRDEPRRPSVPPGESAAILSPRLVKIFREADRRIFPDSPPIDLDLLDRRESARELVPDQLLEVVAMPAVAREEDPLEAFTYVGVVPPAHVGAPLPLPEAGQRFQPQSMTGEGRLPPARPARTEAGAPTSPPSRPPATQAEDPAGDVAPSFTPLTGDLGEPTRDEPTRESVEQRGTVDGAEVLRFLLSITTTSAPTDIRVTIDETTQMELTVAKGRLTRLIADVHVRVLTELHRQGRLDDVPVDEARAVSILDARVSAGVVGRFEADRVLRRAREACIHDLSAARSLEFDVTLAEAHRTRDVGLIAAPLSAVLTEGARRRIDASRLRHLLGGGALVLDVPTGLSSAADALGLEPEVAQVIERHDRGSVDALLSEVPADEGIAGALFALFVVDAVRIRSRSADRTMIGDPADAVRALIETAHALAEEGCYFDVLGVDPAILPRDLRSAYEARRAELAGIDLDVHGLTQLSAQHKEAIEVVDEAWEVLRDEATRTAYRAALGL